MKKKTEWKRMNLNGTAGTDMPGETCGTAERIPEGPAEPAEERAVKETAKRAVCCAAAEPGDCGGKSRDVALAKSRPSSGYLIASRDNTEEYQKDLLYRLLAPVFFGSKRAGNGKELALLFQERYGIDVRGDFCEGDEHYEEYLEAQQAIAEGMSVYCGAIDFEDCVLAELAERLWADMEKEGNGQFRRINTMLEE